MIAAHPGATVRVAVWLCLLGFITHSTYAGSGDEPHYLAITHSAAFDLDFDLANNYGSNEPLIGGGGLATDAHVRPGRGGVIRPVHDVGMPVVFAPVVRVLRPLAAWLSATIPEPAMRRVRLTPSVLYRHLLSIAMIGVAVWLSGMLFDTCTALGASVRAAMATTLIAMLSPPLLVHSTLFFTELPSAAIAFYAFRRSLIAPPERAFGSALTGAAIGVLFLIHARNAGLVLALTALALRAPAAQRRPRQALALLAGLAVLMVIRTGINYAFWGTWMTTPHAALGAPDGLAATLREIGIRVAGMTIDQEFGLLPYAPILALCAVGLLAMRQRPVAAAIGFASVCYLALILWPVTNVHGWTGGWSPAARFMVPIVPLLALSLPAAFAATPRTLLALLVILQLVIDGYMWQNPKNLWNDGDGVAAVCSRGGLPICQWLPSVTQWGPP